MFRSLGNLTNVCSVVVLATGLCCTPALAAEPAIGVEAAKSIPVIDAHFHVLRWMDGRELLAHMDSNGIQSSGGVGGGNLEAITQLGSRFIRPTGMGLWLSLHRSLDAAAFENPETPAVRQALAVMEVDLRDRGARAIGEIHVNALTSTQEPSNRFKTPADSATLRAMFALAAKYSRPLNIHAQWDPDTAHEIARLAASSPAGRLVLAHCGSSTAAADVRRMFEEHANVACDLSARGSPPLPAMKFSIFSERGLLSDWQKLIEDYPDRFVVGIDTVHDWQEYDRVVRAIRYGLLANLSPAAAEKVAYRNAQSWFGLQ